MRKYGKKDKEEESTKKISQGSSYQASVEWKKKRARGDQKRGPSRKGPPEIEDIGGIIDLKRNPKATRSQGPAGLTKREISTQRDSGKKRKKV